MKRIPEEFPRPLFEVNSPLAYYIHYPFCARRCVYCDFFFRVNLKLRERIEAAILKEISLYRDLLGGLPSVRTLYIGGGTPSLASVSFLENLRMILDLTGCVEYTLEVNPEDVTKARVKGWLELGVNRLSIGIQSFEEEDLKWLGRIHDRRRAMEALEAIAGEGCIYSVDLLLGLPSGREMETLKEVLAFRPHHISVYVLTVEEGTVLWKELGRGVRELPEEERIVERFYQVRERLLEEGYGHYEISNYALPGYEARHNVVYWERGSYLGLGPSAHSFSAPRYRWWNVYSLGEYERDLGWGDVPWGGYEVLDEVAIYNEEIMLGLRYLKKGVEVEKVRRWKGWELEELIGSGFLFERKGRLHLTEAGLIRSDEVIRRLMV